MTEDFAVYIPSYKRVDRQLTYEAIREMGYTGEIYIVVGLDDPTLDDYKERYGDEIITFDKYDYMDNTDSMTNEKKLETVVYARNAILDMAREAGKRFILMMDDDLLHLRSFETREKLSGGFQEQVGIVVEFMKSTGVEVVTYGYSHYIRQRYGRWQRPMYQSFYIDLESDIRFQGESSDDEIYYLRRRRVGKQMTAIEDITIHTPSRGLNEGGLKDLYDGSHYYQILFYTFMEDPPACRFRYNQKIDNFSLSIDCSEKSYPQVLNEKWRKTDA